MEYGCSGRTGSNGRGEATGESSSKTVAASSVGRSCCSDAKKKRWLLSMTQLKQ